MLLCRTACGSCRYIQPGFDKLCRNSDEHDAAVIFLKHNIIDECALPSCVSLPLTSEAAQKCSAVRLNSIS